MTIGGGNGRFGSALAALALAGVTWIGVRLAEPHLAVAGVMTRGEIWRLTVFTEATLVLLTALSVWIGRKAGSRGVRDVAGEESPSGSGEQEREKDEQDGGPGWVTAFGLWLLTIYAAGALFAGLF